MALFVANEHINVTEVSNIPRYLADVTQLTGRPPTITLAHTFLNLGPKLLNVRDCAPDFAMKTLEYRNDFDTTG